MGSKECFALSGHSLRIHGSNVESREQAILGTAGSLAGVSPPLPASSLT